VIWLIGVGQPDTLYHSVTLELFAKIVSALPVNAFVATPILSDLLDP
jgi:hypothetical protein